MKKLNLFKNCVAVTTFLILIVSTSYAQLKIGNNPTTLGTDANFQVEGNTTSDQFIVLKNGNLGIGTNTPSAGAILDLTATNKALLLTRVANTAAVTSPVNGMIIYDISSNCIKAYENGAWSGCLSYAPEALPTVSVTCNGFTGTYNINQVLSGAKYSVTLTNNSFASATIVLATTDLILSGVSGYTVTAVSQSSVSLISGASATIDYTISGISTTSGTLTGNWTKLTLSCTDTKPVTNNLFVASLNCGTATFSPSSDFVQGQAYIGTLTVPYTGGNNIAYPSQTIISTGITGFTAVLQAGTLSNNTGGILIFNVTGTTTIATGTGGYTPSGATTGADFIISFGGQTCTKTNVVIPNLDIQYNLQIGSSSNGSVFTSIQGMDVVNNNSAGYISTDYLSGTKARFPYKGTYTITFPARSNITRTGVNVWNFNMSTPIFITDIDTNLVTSPATGILKEYTATNVTVGTILNLFLQACQGCSPNTTVDYNDSSGTQNKVIIKLTSHN